MSAEPALAAAPEPPPSPSRGPAVAAAVLAVPTLLILAQRLVRASFVYDKWTDRDLVRATAGWLELPTAGAELSYGDGGRIPGGALYLLLGPPMWLTGDPTWAWRTAAGLDALGLLALVLTLRRHHGPLAAAAAALLYVTDDVWVRTTIKLWNPTFLPLLVSLSIAALYRLRAEGRASGLVGWLAALAVGAQVHLSAALWLVATAPAALATKVAHKGRALGLGALAVLLAYAPYLVDEARAGWPNTRLLLRQPEIARTSATLAAGPARAAMTLARLLGLTPEPSWTAWSYVAKGLPAWIAVGGLVLALAARRLGRTDGAAAGARAVAVGVLLVLVGYVVDGSLELSQRYLLVLAPALAALGGIALGEAARRAGRGGPIVAALGVALLVGRAAPTLQHLHFRGRADLNPETWEGLNGLLAAVGEELGTDLRGVAGRTVVVRGEGQGRKKLAWKADTAIDYLLLRVDAAFPGSLAPPCALVVDPGEAAPGDDPALATLLGSGVASPHVVRTVDLDRERRLLVYDVDGLCPTSLTQRYLRTPVEEQLFQRYEQLPTDRAEELPAEEGVRRFAAAVVVPSGAKDAPDVRIAVAVDLAVRGDVVVATLHAPQLRGDAYNTGWFASGLVAHPALALANEALGRSVTLGLADGWVGFRSPVAPLGGRTEALPRGTWTVALTGMAVPVVHEAWPAPGSGGTGFFVPITTVEIPDVLAR